MALQILLFALLLLFHCFQVIGYYVMMLSLHHLVYIAISANIIVHSIVIVDLIVHIWIAILSIRYTIWNVILHVAVSIVVLYILLIIVQICLLVRYFLMFILWSILIHILVIVIVTVKIILLIIIHIRKSLQLFISTILLVFTLRELIIPINHLLLIELNSLQQHIASFHLLLLISTLSAHITKYLAINDLLTSRSLKRVDLQ